MQKSIGFLFLLLTFLSGYLVRAQDLPGETGVKPVRIEIPTRSDAETYRIETFGKEGFILFFRSTEVVDDTLVRWYFALHDTNFRQKWIRSIAVPAMMDLYLSQQKKDTLVLLYQIRPKEKNDFCSHFLLKFPVNGDQTVGWRVKVPEDHDLTAFLTTGSKAYFALASKNSPASVLIFDLDASRSVIRTLPSATPSSILSLTTDSSGTRLLISLKKQFGKNTYENYLVLADREILDPEEILISPIIPNRFLRDLQFIPQENKNFLVFGTYGFGTGQRSNTSRQPAGDLAGIFFCEIRNGQQHGATLTNFLDLKNVNALLGERDQLAVKKKKAKNPADIQYLSLNFNLLFHPVEQSDGKFLLFLESYNPEYSDESYTDFDFYGRPYTISVPVFRGYRYMNGIAAAVQSDGKVVWDNTIEVRNLITPDLIPRIQLRMEGSQAVFAYLSEGKVATKVISGNAVLEPLDFCPLELPNPGDKLIRETRSNMLPWYGRYYLCLGYQEIKAISKPENAVRTVFSITKVRFEP